MTTPAPFPSRNEGDCLHVRLLASDPTAPADLCAVYLDPLSAWLEARFPRVDAHLRLDAAGRALFGYAQHPQRFDPHRLDLAAYLRMSARGDLLNLLRDEARHHAERRDWRVVEEGEEAGNVLQGDPPDLRLLRDEDEAWARDVVLRVRQESTPGERRALDLMLSGERRTDAYAAGLGLDALPGAEQEREVKRVKDRLKKRLQRRGEGHA